MQKSIRFSPKGLAVRSPRLILACIAIAGLAGCEKGGAPAGGGDAGKSAVDATGRAEPGAVAADPPAVDPPAANAPPVQPDAAETKAAGLETVLFDGTSLDHFRGYQQEAIGAGWKIEDGVLYFDGSGGGDLCTREEFGDFDLSFDWKVSEGANSGVMFRVSLGDSAPYLSGPEFQVLDDSRHADGRNELTSAGSLYALVAPRDKELKPVGEWNSARIVLKGSRVQHWLNEKLVVDIDMSGEEYGKLVAASKFRDWEKFGRNPRGHICFQDHGNPVWFRGIRIRDLAGE